MGVLQRTRFAIINLNNFRDDFGLKAEALAKAEGVSISQVSVGRALSGLPPIDKNQALACVHLDRLAPFTCRIHIFCRPQDEERVKDLLLALRGEVLDRLKAMVKINEPS
jgi:hypothetical protein